jgi:uncharacterized protein YkwD
MVHVIALTISMSLFQDVNREREAHGLKPLILDARLSDVAGMHASDMMQHKYFAHVSPDGLTPFDRMREAGCEFEFAGENIAIASDERDAQEALSASPPHRRNTLSEQYRRVGIGVASDAQGDIYFVEDFSD